MYLVEANLLAGFKDSSKAMKRQLQFFTIPFSHIVHGPWQRFPGILFRQSKHTSSAKFEQIHRKAQPQPLSAQSLIKQTPVEIVDANFIYCDGGSYLGHPRIFINLVALSSHSIG
jgi:hypothetical protein